MEPSGFCPACKQPLPADTPLGGVCPQCLLKSGFYSGTAPEPERRDKFAAPAIADLAPHFPQLEIVELIGRGGMGAVYKARQPRLNRLVALKVLAREQETDARFADRFLREAQALAQMNHPNIVTVHDFGEAGGHYYLVMEYVDGLNLRELERSKKLTPEEALTIVPPICDALQYAHQQGIVHRDIKPENILIDKQGRVKIADFGIAKILGVSAPDEPLTGEQQRVGTPLYMAPEQVEKPTTVDHRADIYSLGVVFYEMLTGELPIGRFAAPSQKVEIDVRLDEIVMRALEKEPALRYQQVSEIKTQMETLSTPSVVDRAPVSPNVDSLNQRPVLIITAVFMGMMLLIGPEFLSGIRLIFWVVGFGFGLAVTLYRLYQQRSPRHNITGIASDNRASPKPNLSAADRARVRSQLIIPAIGLIISAVLSMVPMLFVIFRLLVTVIAQSNGTQPPAWKVGFISIPLLFISTTPIITLFGAMSLLQVKRRAAAIAAAYLAMITPPGLLLGLPFGIWALLVLNREDVKAAFRTSHAGRLNHHTVQQHAESPANDKWKRNSSSGLLSVFWIFLGLGLFLVFTEPTLLPKLFEMVEPNIRQLIVWLVVLAIILLPIAIAMTKGRKAGAYAFWITVGLLIGLYYIFPKTVPYLWRTATSPGEVPKAATPPLSLTPYFRLMIHTIPAQHMDPIITNTQRMPATYPPGIIPLMNMNDQRKNSLSSFLDVTTSSALALLPESTYKMLTDDPSVLLMYDEFHNITSAFQTNGYGINANIGAPYFDRGRFRSTINVSIAEAALLVDLHHNIFISPEQSSTTLGASFRYNGSVGDKEVLVSLMPYTADGMSRYVVIGLDKTSTSSGTGEKAVKSSLKDQRFPDVPVLHYNNGVRARIVAVSPNPPDNTAWTSDGLSTTTVPDNNFNEIPPETKPGFISRNIYFAVDNINPGEVTVKASTEVDSLRSISAEANYVLGRVSTNLPEDVRQTSVSIGVAATTWTTHLSQGLGNVSSDYSDSSLPEKISVILNQPDYQSDKVIIPVAHSAAGMDVRLVLTDTNGNRHIGRPRISSAAGELNSVQFEFKVPEPGVRYKLQEFQTRPFEWKTFDNIALMGPR